MTDTRNTYIFCFPDGKSKKFTLDKPGRFDFDDTYFVEGLKEMERLGVEGRTFLFAYDARVPLPCKGPDVVVILYGDERRLIPPYLHEVGAVFTCFGMTPVGGCAPILTRQGLLETVDIARRIAEWLPGAARRAAQAMTGRRAAPVTRIALGYQRLVSVPFVPFADRAYILSFLGSLSGNSGRSLKTLFGTPKTAARGTLVSILEDMKAAGAPVEIDVTAGYRESLSRGPVHFSQVLMDTRICPVPRGTTLETARYFAAAKFGCIVVAERQPPSRIFADPPAITIRHWKHLPGLVAELLADPVRMEELHRRSLLWWDEVCAEPVLGRDLASALGVSATLGDTGERNGQPAAMAPAPAGAATRTVTGSPLRHDERGLA